MDVLPLLRSLARATASFRKFAQVAAGSHGPALMAILSRFSKFAQFPQFALAMLPFDPNGASRDEESETAGRCRTATDTRHLPRPTLMQNRVAYRLYQPIDLLAHLPASRCVLMSPKQRHSSRPPLTTTLLSRSRRAPEFGPHGGFRPFRPFRQYS